MAQTLSVEFVENELIDSIFDINKNSSLHHQYLINGYARECNKCIPDQELIIITCLWYYYQINIYAPANSFDDMDLKDNILRGVYSYGFEKPSLIQQYAIKPMICS